MAPEKSFEKLAGLLAVFVLAAGCLAIILPFLTAVVWAIILAYSIWPLYLWLDRRLGGRRMLTATAVTLLVTVVLIVPFGVVIMSIADDTARLARTVEDLVGHGLPPPPDWIAGLPLVGSTISEYWAGLAGDRESLSRELGKLVEPAAKVALAAGATLGKGLAELVLSVIIAWFIFASGTATALRLRAIMDKLTVRTEHLLEVAGSTVRGVVYGIIGTALAQGILAGIGFWIAGVPGALFLGFITFLVSIIPGGPPLVWIPATLWLAWQGEVAWSVFMGAWGLLVVSSVDNIIKPYLISRGTNLPFILVLLGALGGVLAFGFVGIFIGPTMLAVAFNLLNDWTAATAAGAGAGADRHRTAGPL